MGGSDVLLLFYFLIHLGQFTFIGFDSGSSGCREFGEKPNSNAII